MKDIDPKIFLNALIQSHERSVKKVMKQKEINNKVNEAFNTYAATVRKNKEQS